MLGARLRPGDTSLGERDVEDVEQWLDRARAAVGPRTLVTVRIDAGGDCASLLHAIERKGAWFLVKLKWTPNLVGAVWATEHWTTVDRDALGQPVCQVAEVDFLREDWAPEWRVFAVRSRERRSGHQTGLWEDMDYSTHFYVTNDHAHDADDLARRYDGRAGIEPIIAELKGGLAIGKVSTEAFDANEAAFLLKLLAFNLLPTLGATAAAHHPTLARVVDPPRLRPCPCATPARRRPMASSIGPATHADMNRSYFDGCGGKGAVCLELGFHPAPARLPPTQGGLAPVEIRPHPGWSEI